ncbi:hypothetical protein O181_012268 [Austropuccinia psidii MF-1]|uniref:Retrotransposon gag domain-containing protein n=1 Tax=Austropuccinia psidii MF-1 TaxID=1389203 RepID=A0A9Q3GM25_9BASI|nr:hypothetical protein [Austropuccinia psidii MF-1]
MPLQHSPPARQTRSQARAHTVLTQTLRAPLDNTPEVLQLRAKLDRGPILEGRKRAKEMKGPGEDDEEEEENSVEEEESDGTEGVPAPVGASQGTGGPTLAQSNQPVSHKYELSLLAIMQQMTQIMANIQAASSFEASRPPAFKNLSMKAPECFDGIQTFKVRSFIQSCQLIFHNDPANFSQDRKEFLYATSFLIGRAAKWIEPYLSNITNQDSNYLLNSWKLFESELITIFGDPNEVRKAEAELDSLRMNKGVHVSLYIAYYRSLVSIIRDWGERALINHFRRGFHPGFWINWPPILQESTLFKTYCTLPWSLIPALVGDSRTPSLPSSVHIPSINSHQSLLSFRDEVFKEIQDFGEDNSVFSIHIFFGNMDLPPSSYHDCLQELWNEEEEPEGIETMMKVVPSVYYQYLDPRRKQRNFLFTMPVIIILSRRGLYLEVG